MPKTTIKDTSIIKTFFMLLLYDRQGDAVDFLIDVEGIDVGHATDVVDDRHETRLEVGRVDVILARHTTDKVLRVETIRMDGGTDKLLHERLDDLIT